MTTTDEPRPTRRPDAWDAFRWAHLLLVVGEYEKTERRHPLFAGRLAVYDFFSGHPYLLFSDLESEEAGRLTRAGFERGSLVYASAPQRLSNRREQVQTDIGALVSRSLVTPVSEQSRLAFRSTEEGLELASQLMSLHAQAVRVSAGLVTTWFDRLSDQAVRREAARLAENNALAVDVLGDF